MRNVQTRLSKLERRIVPQSPPVSRSKVLPELRALFDELSPILEQSEDCRKMMEEAKVHGITPEERRTFWVMVGELLSPHPALKERIGELLRKQVAANEAADARGA